MDHSATVFTLLWAGGCLAFGTSLEVSGAFFEFPLYELLHELLHEPYFPGYFYLFVLQSLGMRAECLYRAVTALPDS